MKKIAIIGTNGMLSVALTQAFFKEGNIVDSFGLSAPIGYESTSFTPIDLCKETIDVCKLKEADIIIYAAGAGVQAAIQTNPLLMYQLNVNVPIDLTIRLKQADYKGVYISFGSYMEIGLNDIEDKKFTEEEILCSPLHVTNDYALSKRIYGRYINDFSADFTYWHFILPNMFSYNDRKPGTRLIPYVLQYLREYKQGANPDTPNFSAGTQKRQYILLEEIKNVIDLAYENHITSGVYNIGGGQYSSIRNFIEELFKAYDVPCKDSYFGKETRRDGDIKSLCIDGSKLLSAIKYLPQARMCDILSE